MTDFECSRYALFVTRTDILCTGMLLGGIVVIVSRWANEFLERKFSVDQKKMDLMLGEALMKMKAELEDKILYMKKKP